jgi:hypothetical protein
MQLNCTRRNNANFIKKMAEDEMLLHQRKNNLYNEQN